MGAILIIGCKLKIGCNENSKKGRRRRRRRRRFVVPRPGAGATLSHLVKISLDGSVVLPNADCVLSERGELTNTIIGPLASLCC
jgi:hypothetical protein